MLRKTGARGYETGFRAPAEKLAREPRTSARAAVPEFAGERTAAGVELRFVLERCAEPGIRARVRRPDEGDRGTPAAPLTRRRGRRARPGAVAPRAMSRATTMRRGAAQRVERAGARRRGAGPCRGRVCARLRVRIPRGHQRGGHEGRGSEEGGAGRDVLGGGQVRQTSPSAGRRGGAAGRRRIGAIFGAVPVGAGGGRRLAGGPRPGDARDAPPSREPAGRGRAAAGAGDRRAPPVGVAEASGDLHPFRAGCPESGRG